MDAARGAWSPRLVRFAIALQALVLASSDPTGATSSVATPDPALLAGCTARRASGDVAWRYECQNFVASVIDDPRSLEPGPYLDGREKDIRHAAEQPMTFSRDTVRIAGRDVSFLRATGARAAPVVVAVLVFSSGTRAVTCMGHLERCAAVVEALAAVPWRAGPALGARVRDAGELPFGGAGPVVPTGCLAMPTFEPDRVGMLVCPGNHSAGWMSGERVILRMREEWVSRIRSSRRWSDPEEVPCRVAGLAASCTRLTAREAARREVAMWGTALVDEPRFFAYCTAAGDEPVPAPCSSVFSPR